MINNEFRLLTERLDYDTQTSKSVTRGSTLGLTDDGDTLKTATGLLYNRQTRYAEVYYGQIINNDFYIQADTLFSYDSISTYQAFRNIEIISASLIH